MSKPISYAPDRIRLRLEPNGVYFVDGRVIPVRHDACGSVDNGKAIVPVHDGCNLREGLLGSLSRMDVEQRKLELVPPTKIFDPVAHRFIVLSRLHKIVCDEQVVGHDFSLRAV